MSEAKAALDRLIINSFIEIGSAPTKIGLPRIQIAKLICEGLVSVEKTEGRCMGYPMPTEVYYYYQGIEIAACDGD